jgi:hypothetical protein
MYLKLTHTNWEKPEIVFPQMQKDYGFFEAENISVFIYGYPYNSDSVNWVTANVVWKQYKSNDLKFIDEIDGVYAIVILDKTKDDCKIIIDRYGIYSLFYYNESDFLIISDRIREIIAQLQEIELDKQSIIEYLCIGFKIGNKTHIKGIYEFEFGRIYTIHRDLGISEKLYWDWRCTVKPESEKASEEEIRTAFNKHILIGLKLSDSVSLPLSGGLDSRTVLSACYPLKEKIHCYTHGLKKSIDVKLARRMCKHLQIKHNYYELEKEWGKRLTKIIDGDYDIFNGLNAAMWHLHLKNSYEEQGPKGEVFFVSIHGERWRKQVGGKPTDSLTLEDVASKFVDKTTQNGTNIYNVYKDLSVEDIKKSFYNNIRNELLKAGTNLPDALSHYFYHSNYGANWGRNSIKYTGKYFKIFIAYLNKEMWTETPLMSLEGEEDISIQRHIISKNNPYLLKLMLSRTNKFYPKEQIMTKNLLSILEVYYKFLFVFFPMGLNKIWRALFKTNIFHMPYFTDYPNWLRKYHKEFLLDILNYDNMIMKDIFDKEKFIRLLKSFIAGNDSLRFFITRILSLEIWLKKTQKDTKIRTI